MSKSYKHELIIGLFLLGLCVTFYFLYGILVAFLLGLLLAFAAKPMVERIQRKIPNRAVATTLYLIGLVGITILFLLLFTKFINRDFNRFNQSFSLLVSNNQEDLDETAQKVKGYISDLYASQEMELKADSLMTELQELDYSQLDTESISAGYDKIMSVFENDQPKEESTGRSFGVLYILISTVAYFVLILYQLDYFEGLKTRYFSGEIKSKLTVLFDDFNQSFLRYLKLRTKIVLWLALIYLIAFFIMDMPGMIFITLIILVLSYIPYLQYLALIPLLLGCLVLSIENPHSFLFYFGIVLGVFVLASIVEELLLTPLIMEKHIGMNPVIMVLALAVWGYVLGTPGLLIGIPLTSLFIIYVKRYIVPIVSD
ncbi:MAG: putative PurR-regulated permease PerM [Flavobacteriales bacterium]|jgi:predicted PurR-regulated permease PerM